MSKQTRLNFGQPPSKRRRLNSSEKATVPDDDDVNKKSTNSSITKATDQDSSTESEPTNEAELENKNPTSQQPSPNQEQVPTLTLTHYHANLFTAPPHILLCHATNAQGTWGAGIAAAFKKSYPAAFKLYASHCDKWSTHSLLGTTFLIQPQTQSPLKAEREAQHWIGCLFTSERKGKAKGSKESILEATGDAVADLVRRVRGVNEDASSSTSASASASSAAAGSNSGSSPTAIASVRMCKINSGLFGVPWQATSAVVEGVEVGEGDLKEIEVFSMD